MLLLQYHSRYDLYQLEGLLRTNEIHIQLTLICKYIQVPGTQCRRISHLEICGMHGKVVDSYTNTKRDELSYRNEGKGACSRLPVHAGKKSPVRALL